MAEYSKIAKGSFTSTGAAKAIYLPFQPDTVKIWNYGSYVLPAANGVPRAYWDSSMGQGYAVIDVFAPAVINTTGPVTSPFMTGDYITSNGISTFSAGNLFQYGAQQQVVASTKGTTTSFQVTAHGYSAGDVVMFQGLYKSATTGMPQICGMPFVVSSVTDANNFVINWNSNNSSYTDLSASPSGAYVKKVLYPFLYAPGVSFISAISTGTTTTITTTAPHNLVVGSQVAFAIPSEWGTTQLDSYIPGSSTIPGSPIYGYVISVGSSTQVTVNINSTGFTAYTTAVSVAAIKAGVSFPQMIAVGDVNTGGVQISSGSVLYPPPVVNSVNTINGPAIQGAFVNNTRQGFIIGTGTGVTYTSATAIGLNGNVIYWEAMLHDYASP